MGKQILLLLIFTSFCFLASSQNLVPNHSFENYDTSYTATIFPYFNHTFEALNEWRTEWDMFNTPDLFFEESYIFFQDIPLFDLVTQFYEIELGENYASSPTNYAGFQYPRTGSNYIGIRTETPIVLNTNGTFSNNPYFEYIQIGLNDTLEAGKSYQVSFYVSAAENNILENNTLGVLLSEESEFNFGTLPVDPDIVVNDSLTSSEEWVEIKGNYIAEGGEKFLSIGNLNLVTVADTFILEGLFNSIYYYIDDVSVFENKTLDTTLCPNDTLVLSANIGSSHHLWQDGSTDSVFNVTEAGTYWYRGTYENINHTDTFIVNYYEPLTITTTGDTSICYNESIEIVASHNFNNVQYNWSTGDTTNSITVSESGLYTIAITNLCQKQAETIMITQIPKIEFELGNDTILCHNASLLLSPQLNNGTYYWQDGSNEFIYLVNNSGQYSLTISNECESDTDSINIEILDQLELDLGQDLVVCEFPITLSVYNEGAQYTWHDESENDFFTINESSTISVNVSNECESLNDTLNINHFCGCEFFIPTAFTPNNDKKNDLFDVTIDPQCQLKKYRITIYNRWGENIFSSDNITHKWNGKFKNKLIQSGVYSYHIEYQFYGEARKRILGSLLLIN